MGRRRKRSNSDLDDSLEERYNKYTYHGESDAGNRATLQGEMKSVVVKKSEVSTSSISPSKRSRLSLIETTSSSSEIGVVCDKEKQRIERLRQQKKRRKERKKAKDFAKKETMEKQSDAKKSSKESDQGTLPLKKKKKDNPNKEFQIMAKGVQYRDVAIGKGPVVKERKKIRVSYVLRSHHRYGKILDSSNDFRFRLGRGEVIKGWDLGLLGMRQGGKRHLIVPPNAGYGGRDVGAGKGGLLFFELTVLDC